MLRDSTEIQRRFSVAQEILVTECMQRQGFEYSYEPPSILDESEVDEQLTPTVAFARDFEGWDPAVHGYRRLDLETGEYPVDGEPEAPGVAQSDAPDPSLEEAWFDALLGPTSGGEEFQADFGAAVVTMSKEGCLGQAVIELGDDEAFLVSTFAAGFSTLRSEMFNRTDADERLQSAVRVWSECMAAAGYRSSSGSAFESLRQARDEGETDGEQPTPAERQMAESDKACQVSADYVAIFTEVYEDHERDVLNQPEAAAMTLRWLEIGDEPARRIAAVLAENGVTT